MKESVKSRDMFLYRFPSELRVSPSGKRLGFILTHMEEACDGYRSDLYLMEPEKGAESIRRITASGDVKTFCWEDEDALLFPSARKNPKPGTTDYYRIRLSGGEAEPAFSVPEAGTLPQTLYDGRRLLKLKRKTDPKTPEADRAEEGKDFWTFTDKPFIRNGEAFGERRRMMLGILRDGEAETELITPKYYEVAGFTLSPDRKRVLYFGEEYESCNSLKQSLYEYNAETKETKELIAPGQYQISLAAYCEAGIFLQASALSRSATQNHDLFLLSADGALTKLASPDGMYTTLIDVDVVYGGGSGYQICGDKLIGARLRGVKTVVEEVDLRSGAIRRIGEVDAFTCMAVHEQSIYLAALNDYSMCEIYRMDRADGTLTRLSSFGDAYLSSHEVVRPEYLGFVSSNGEQVDGFVIKPAGFEEGKKYPGVLMIHGGPKWAYGEVFMQQMQCLSSAGMFVFYCNPHGSDAYGDSFLEMVGEWGKDDYLHCMEFTDEVLKRYPQLDSAHLGVTGGSYGGYMTNWIIGHTDRFSAAVSQRGICNLITECLTVDIGERLMKQAGGEATPWNGGEELLWEMSPLKYVKHAKTPTLFLHSERDYRCFPGEAMQMFTAMKQCGIPTELIMYRGENHGLSRGGRPSNRIHRIEAVLEWFQKYI